MDHLLIDFENVPWETPGPGVRTKSKQVAGKQLRLVEFTRDFVEPDWCEKGHVGYVLKGELHIDFDGTVRHYKPGMGLIIPAGKKFRHKAKVLGDFVHLVLVEDV
ncbi:MAG: cupin domain-containing protein [bacterium]